MNAVNVGVDLAVATIVFAAHLRAGGWVGGWVGGLNGEEENEAVGMSYWMRWVGGVDGEGERRTGWVGGWVTYLDRHNQEQAEEHLGPDVRDDSAFEEKEDADEGGGPVQPGVVVVVGR